MKTLFLPLFISAALASSDSADVRSQDPLRVLGVSAQSTRDEVKSNYRAAALKYHPDIPREDSGDEDRKFRIGAFKAVSVAFKLVLNWIDDDRRGSPGTMGQTNFWENMADPSSAKAQPAEYYSQGPQWSEKDYDPAWNKPGYDPNDFDPAKGVYKKTYTYDRATDTYYEPVFGLKFIYDPLINEYVSDTEAGLYFFDIADGAVYSPIRNSIADPIVNKWFQLNIKTALWWNNYDNDVRRTKRPSGYLTKALPGSESPVTAVSRPREAHDFKDAEWLRYLNPDANGLFWHERSKKYFRFNSQTKKFVEIADDAYVPRSAEFYTDYMFTKGADQVRVVWHHVPQKKELRCSKRLLPPSKKVKKKK